MNVLGLHFGHDGGVAVICNGVVKVALLTERVSRIKHANWIDESMIDMALAEAGLTIKDIAYCAISTTQGRPVVTLKGGRLKLKVGRHPKDKIPSLKEEKCEQDWERLRLPPHHRVRKSAAILDHALYRRDSAKPKLPIHQAESDNLDLLYMPESPVMAEDMVLRDSFESIVATPIDTHVLSEDTRRSCHAPMIVEFDGHAIPSAHVEHHACHAASAYYQSGLQSAAVFTYDGADDPLIGSDAFVGFANKLYRVAVPQLWCGSFYTHVAVEIGVSDAGKLMGLASYGKARLNDAAFLGTTAELGFISNAHTAEAWLKAATTKALDLGYEVGGKRPPLDRLNIDLAASAQKTFEEEAIAFAKILKTITTRLPWPVEGLCVSGGCALSCPTNTRLAIESGFSRVFVEPACDDSGLCVGAALWVYHNLCDQPTIHRDAAYPISPYLGKTYSARDVENALDQFARDCAVESLGPLAPSAAAADLANNAIIGWFEGRSEIGPRALGHRSVLADPRPKDNWPRTNQVKGREGWRPFAPSVLEEDAGRWFKDMPLPSPYMLFTGNVVDPAALPAITHVDGTARVQTVGPATGGFYNVIKEFRKATDCGVVLNTSLNGPGEPIVETAEDAIRFLKSSELDAIYIDGFRVSKTGKA